MKKVMALVMAASMTAGVFAGCGSKNETSNNSSSNTTSTNNSTEEKKEESNGPIVLRETGGKVETLNPHLSASTAESDLHKYMTGNMLEMILNEEGDNFEIVPFHAKALPTRSEDGLVWTFELSEDAKFADNTPITAETYEYSLKMLIDPKLLNIGAQSLMNDVTVLNANKYFKGECEWQDVGVKAIEGNKLQITLEYAVSEMDFLNLFTGGGNTAAVHPEIYETSFNEGRTENAYGTTFETSPSSGAYTLTEWVRDQITKFEKNPESPLADVYTPDIIESRVVEDATTMLTLFKNGDTDYVSVSGANYDEYAEDPRLHIADTTTVWYMYINSESQENPVLCDNDFRQALYYAIDRKLIAETVFKTAKPAPYYVADTKMATPDMKYRDTEAAKAVIRPNNGHDPELAKEFFDKAYEANGNKKIEVEMMYFDSSDNMKLTTEYLEETYENLFGKDRLDIKLIATPTQAVYENMENGKFQIGFGGWSGGEFNPWATMVVHTSDYPAKHDRLRNKEYDELYNRTCKGDLIFETEERIEALAKMEEIIYAEMPMVPIWQAGSAKLFSDRITLKTEGEKSIPGVGFAILQADFAN